VILETAKSRAASAIPIKGVMAPPDWRAGAARTFQQIYYQGYYLADSYRITNKLTLNLGVRLDIIGSFSERFDRTVVFDPGATDPLGQKAGLNLKGQLALVASPAYPSRNQLGSAKYEPAPRFGYA